MGIIKYSPDDVQLIGAMYTQMNVFSPIVT